MSGFKTILNGQLVPEPSTLPDFDFQIILDEERRMLRYNYEGDLEFQGVGYDIIEEAYMQSPNAEVTVVIVDEREQPKVVCNGIIKISNCTFNLTQRTVSCEVDDNTFQSRILSNYETELSVTTVRDAFGDAMTGADPFQLTLVNSETADELATTREAFDWFDCIRAALVFSIGGNVEIASDFYDGLPNREKYCIASGLEMRLPGSSNARPITTLKALWEEMARRYDLYMILENPFGDPIIRIERKDILYPNETSIVMRDVIDVERSISFDELYSSIRIGNRAAIRGIDDNYPWPYLQLITNVQEEYNIETRAGVNKRYDLSLEYIADTNVIYDVLIIDPTRDPDQKNTTYDDSIFIMQYNPANDNTVTTSAEFVTTITPNLRVYSPDILNSEILRRHRYLGNVALSLGLMGTEFSTTSNNTQGSLALQPSGDTSYSPFLANPVPFNIVLADPGTNYDNTTFKYTAPVTGVYEFEFRITAKYASAQQVGVSPIGNLGNSFRVGFNVDDVLQDLQNVQVSWAGAPFTTLDQNATAVGSIGTPIITATVAQVGQEFEILYRQAFWLESGQEVSSLFQHFVFLTDPITTSNNNLWQYSLSGFKTSFSPGVGGLIESASEESVYIQQYDFEHPLSSEEIDALVANPNQSVQFDTGDGQMRKAYIREVTITRWNGETTFVLIFNRQQSTI